jgi:hypothetical protein
MRDHPLHSDRLDRVQHLLLAQQIIEPATQMLIDICYVRIHAIAVWTSLRSDVDDRNFNLSAR